MSSVDELLDLTPAHKSEWNDSEYAVYVYTPNRYAYRGYRRGSGAMVESTSKVSNFLPSRARERNEGKTAGAGFRLDQVILKVHIYS